MKQTFILQPAPHPARQNAIRAVQEAQEGMCVTIQEATRTLEQNSGMWPILDEISRLKAWPVNGALQHLEPEEWKDILTANFRKQAPRIAQGLDGGMVLLGYRTRDFGKKEFSEWLDFLNSVLAQFRAEG